VKTCHLSKVDRVETMSVLRLQSGLLDLPPVMLPADLCGSLESFTKWTQSDDFPETGKITYLDGRIILDFNANLIDSHCSVVTEIICALARHIHERDLGYLLTRRVQLVNREVGFSCEPDGFFISWDCYQSGRIRHVNLPAEESIGYEGTPDWVLEVVSPTSEQIDKEQLRTAYYQAGIPEYWLINALGEEIEFTLLVRGEEGYLAAPATDGWTTSPIFGRSFKLTRDLDQAGLWQYTLATRG